MSYPDYPLPDKEEERLVDLATFGVTGKHDPSLDVYAQAANQIIGGEFGFVSFVDRTQQTSAGIHGMEVVHLNREDTMCTFAILEKDVMVVPDARLDDRFKDSPLVKGPPNLVGNVSAIIRGETGLPMGTLCSLSTKVLDVTEEQVRQLCTLRDVVQELLYARRSLAVIQAEMS